MRGVFWWVVMGSLLSSCGRGAGNAGGADAPASGAATSEAAECLADAAAPRSPRSDAPPKIEVAHVLVRHADLARPEGATRTRGAACLRALEARHALEGGESFDEVVAKYSDERTATGGNLGEVAPSELEPRFADAAFALAVDEMSYVVETDRGFHVIVRLE